MPVTVGELNAVLRLSKRDFDQGMGEAEGRFSRFGGTAKSLAKGVALGAGAAVAGAAIAGTKALFDFDTGMREVFTLMPNITDQARTAMQDDVLAFAKSAGVVPGEVMPALYQAISAGVPPDNVFDFLETANKAAVGGITDLSTSVDGITSVINAYGSDVLSAAEASDLMFTAVRLGKTDFGQLSNSLFQVIPTAAALGVKFGDVTGALAQMTAQGIPTAVATTQLRQLFVELSKDGGKASNAFEELSGKTFTDFIHSGRDVADALEIMQDAAGDSGVALQDMFGSVEAGNAALALGGSNLSDFRGNLSEMDTAAGATEKAFKEMDEGLQRAWNDIYVGLQTWLVEMALEVEKWWGENGPAIVTTMTAAWEEVSEWWDREGPGIIASNERWWDAWIDTGSSRSDTMSRVWEGMQAAWGNTVDGMSVRSEAMSTVWEIMGTSWGHTVDGMSVRSAAMSAVWDGMVGGMSARSAAMSAVWNRVGASWGNTVDGMTVRSQAMSMVWDGMVSGMSVRSIAMSTQLNWIQEQFAKFGEKWAEAWQGVASAAETSGGHIVSGMSVRSKAMATQWNWIQEQFAKFVRGWDSTWQRVASVVGSAWNKIVDTVRSAAATVRSAFDGVTTVITSVINGVIGAATRALNAAIGGINAAVRAYNSIPFVPAVSTISTVSIPRLHTGGRVPGPPGTDQMAVLRAGETVGRSGLGDAQQWPRELRLILGDDQGDDLAEFFMDRGVNLLRSSQGMAT